MITAVVLFIIAKVLNEVVTALRFRLRRDLNTRAKYQSHIAETTESISANQSTSMEVGRPGSDDNTNVVAVAADTLYLRLVRSTFSSVDLFRCEKKFRIVGK